MRVLSTNPEKIHIWPTHAIIPKGQAMDISITFEAITKFRKERVCAKIIHLPQNFLNLQISDMFVSAPFYHIRNFPIVFNY
ncbi:unnamed protein product [Meloidogyne enterolobii]|uniref:Uncharacterized protein n=1 Tax=Meloidogyne enterolobii TaxID=390850 RepID=A0ACB0YPX6_MELEN